MGVAEVATKVNPRWWRVLHGGQEIGFYSLLIERYGKQGSKSIIEDDYFRKLA